MGNLLYRSVGVFALGLVPWAMSGCSSADSTQPELAVTHEALDNANCGYAVATEVRLVNKHGFKAKVRVNDTTGARLKPFAVLINAGSAELVKVAHGTFRKVENGYLLSTVTPDDDCRDEELDDSPDDDADVTLGKKYRFGLKFSGPYTQISALIIAANGSNCDQTAPAVNLAASGNFYTSNGTVTLSASASDNVAVAKVVFSQDDVPIGSDTTAPYRLDVPVTRAINGRHRYTATAYDLTGNYASESKRVLVAIDNKFFGTAAANAADYTKLTTYFSQITPGNGGKWGSVEAVQDQMNWADLDTAYNFAKANGLKFKLHTLVWGQQQPAWIASLPAEQQLAQIDEWMSALATRYPNIELIDVVNEPLHAPPSYTAALGGAGVTGWDWVIKAFEMARAHFPDSELLINDYSTLTMASSTQSYLAIINLLNERGLIDGIGEQGHFYEQAPELPVLATNLGALTETGLPVYISELDVNFADDARQAIRMRDLFSTFWSNPSVLGITHWGYLQDNMWQPNAYLVRRDGTPRAALSWIQCYMAGGTDCSVPAYVPQPRTGDASVITLEAEDYDSAHALLPAGNVVAYASDGAWLGFDNVTFNGNWDRLNVTYALGGATAVNLSIHLGSLDNTPIATVPLAPSGGWSSTKSVSIPWAPLSGAQNVFVRFNGGGANVDKLQFMAPPGTGPNLIADPDFEQGTIDSWWTWSSGTTIANTSSRGVSGTHSVVMTKRTGNDPLVETLTKSVLPGRTYQVSLWASVGGASASAKVTTATQCSPGETTYMQLGGWDNSKLLKDGEWTEFTGELVVPDCALTNVAVWLEGPGSGIELYLDHASVRQVTTSNIIKNGSFEWGTTGWYTWNSGTLSTSAARAHSGTQSLYVANRGSNAPAATDVTGIVKPGSSYPLSVWVSINAPDGGSKSINLTQAATCTSNGTDATTYTGLGQVAVPNGSGWVQLSSTLSVPNCTLKQMQFWVEGGAGADLYVDDVQLLDNSGGSANLINDGTFESGQGSWGGWGYSSLALANSKAHSGTSSLMGASMTANSAIARDIQGLVAPGKRYQATAWVTLGNLAAAAQVKWQTVQRCNAVTSDGFPWLAGATITPGEWTQLSGVVDLSGCTSVEKLLLFAGTGAGDLYIDDVTLTPLP